MVRPPDADPVRADRTLVATARETKGPPPRPSTHSRTRAKAGREATTAPKPTRLATLKAGRTAALAPASTLALTAGRRRPLTSRSAAIAAVSATATDQTPPTADSDVAPQRGSARNVVSRRGRITNDIRRLTAITTASGSAAATIEGGRSVDCARRISAGSKACAVVARSRTIKS